LTEQTDAGKIRFAMSEQWGLVALFGSGETTVIGQRVFDWLLRRLPIPAHAAILETPAGFELNSTRVAERIGEFLERHLQNFSPRVTIVPACKRGTPLSPDEPGIVSPLRTADLIFLGPGSPVYAVRQLQDSLAWRVLTARHRLGAAIVLASSAAVAASACALPVYEIYKVGEDLHWKAGLDFFRRTAYRWFLCRIGTTLMAGPSWTAAAAGWGRPALSCCTPCCPRAQL
jgi:hypothetical protein